MPSAAPRHVLVLTRNPDIGSAAADRFAADGHRVSIAGEALTVTHPDVVVISPAAVVGDDVAAIAAEAVARHGRVDVLVTSPGTGEAQPVFRSDADAAQRAVGDDLDWVWRAVREVAPAMSTAKWGRIVLLSSVASLYGVAVESPYAATMASMLGLTRSLARELGRRRITVNCVAIGVIDTGYLRHLVATNPLVDRHVNNVRDQTPLRRLGTPQEVAEVVAFVASDDAAFLTGAIIPVDGGFAMGF